MSTPRVGDRCMADPAGEGAMLEGVITRIVDDLAWSNLSTEFCGDTPTQKIDGVWVFDSF
jgi:hypothetical protein